MDAPSAPSPRGSRPPLAARAGALRVGILDRYLFREALTTILAMTLVLMGVLLSVRFAFFLGRAARGLIPPDLLAVLVGLSGVRYVSLILPLTLLLGVMLALGRLYKDNEISAMTGCGVGAGRFYRPFAVLAVGLALATGALALVVGPWAGRQMEVQIRRSANEIQYTPFEAGRFKTVGDGRIVFYTRAMDEAAGRLDGVVAVYRERDGRRTFVSAERGHLTVDPATGARLVRFDTGVRYQGTPGDPGYEVARFASLLARVVPPDVSLDLSGNLGVQPLAEILARARRGDAEARAEWQWRLAPALAVLVLTLVAVPLAWAPPRAGAYSKLGWGILVYLFYTQLLALGQAGMVKSPWLGAIGLWWVHLLFVGLGAWLVRRRLRGVG